MRIFCVIGMHRSGTSAVTRMLNLLGVSLGPEEQLLEPAPHNPAGFWENERAVQLNDEQVAALGGNALPVPSAARLEEIHAVVDPQLHRFRGGDGVDGQLPYRRCSTGCSRRRPAGRDAARRAPPPLLARRGGGSKRRPRSRSSSRRNAPCATGSPSAWRWARTGPWGLCSGACAGVERYLDG